jgi:signal transduction histidine kinase
MSPTIVRRSLISILTAFLVLSVFIKTGLSRDSALIFAGDEDFPPYSFIENGSPSGFAVDLVKVLSATMNRDIKIRLMSSQDCIVELQNGGVDGIIGLPVFEELKKNVNYSSAIARLDYAIFVNLTNDYIHTIKSLEGKVVAVPRHAICIDFLKKNRKITLLETDTVEEAFQKMDSGEVTAVICEKNRAFRYIRQENIRDLKIVGSPVEELYKYALAVKKGNSGLIEEIDRAITVLENNGTIEKLTRKWLGITLGPPFPWKKVSFVIGGIMGILFFLMGGLWATSLNSAVRIKTREIEILAQKMQEKDKLAVLGKLAGQIAHELRTPLSIINNSVFLLRREGCDNREKFEKRLGLLEDKVKLTSNILESILSYSRVKADIATTISIKECIEEAISDLEIPVGIARKTTYSDHERLHVFMDFHQLYSIFRNLFLNAIQAMDAKGQLAVSVSAPKEEQMIIVRVSDTGPGLSGISSEQIFNLFSSTKITGTGLGLPISKSIAETNGGTLYLESTGKTGTTFVLKLPSSEMVFKNDRKT